MTAKKNDKGKLPLHLLSGPALFEVAEVLQFGAEEEGYGERNWEEGLSWSRVWGAVQRHLWKWWVGHEADDKSRLSHLAHAACGIMFLQHYSLFDRYSDFDDRPLAHQHGILNRSLPARGGAAPAAGGGEAERLVEEAVSGGVGEKIDREPTHRPHGALVRTELTPNGVWATFEDGTSMPFEQAQVEGLI